MLAQVGGVAQRAAQAARNLFRPFDYPVSASDWLALCGNPQGLVGAHDWGLAMARAGAHARRRHDRSGEVSLERLLQHYVDTRDEQAGEALAAVAARFAGHLDLGSQFDCACTLPPDFRSGPGDPACRLFAWPGVKFPLALRTTQFAWATAAGAAASGPTPLRSTGPVAGLSVLIVTARFEALPVESAVHCLQASGVRRVGVLALVGPDESLAS